MLGKTLSYHFKRGRLRAIGKPFYNGLVAFLLWQIRKKEKGFLFKKVPLVNHKVTAIVKTFERPETLKRLIESIQRLYPHMKIIVVDDSRHPQKLYSVKTIIMPYDSGVSAGRQKALESVTTPYVLLLDDDFILYHETKLEPALEIMEREKEIDIMGGEVVNLPSFKSADYAQARLHNTGVASLREVGTQIAGLSVYDKVPNFYIARTERLQLVGWDKRIKRLDHADFFSRAKGVLVTVLNPQFKVLHAQTPFNETYMKKRNDIDADRMVLRLKYYRY